MVTPQSGPEGRLALALTGIFASPAAPAEPVSRGAYGEGLLVGLDRTMPFRQKRDLVTGVLAEAKSLAPGIWFLDVPRRRVPVMALRVGQQDGVRYAEPDYVMREAAAPDDPSFWLQWPLENTGQTVNGVAGIRGADEGAVAAWDVTTGDTSVVVGVVDSGVDYLHPDLAANIWTNPGGIGGCPAGTHGYNAISGSCDPMDDDAKYFGHGTHVAGIIGAVGNNSTGVTGVNWRTTILPVKFLASNGSGSASRLIAGLEWLIAAKDAGVNVRVVNGSYSQLSYSQALADEIDRLGANNILYVASAGNWGNNNDDPAVRAYPCGNGNANLICVGASTQRDTLPSWSNYGVNTVDLAAPGANIYSTLRNGTYGYIRGTSMAAAEVSGAAALILASTDLSTTALKAQILDNVDPLAALSGKVRTGGRLDICQAVPACHLEPLGKTTVGANGEGLGANRMRVNSYSLEEVATVKRLRVYLRPSTSTTGQQVIRGVIYGDAGAAPGPLLGASDQLVFRSSDRPGWYDLTLSQPVSLQPGRYWIGLHGGSTSSVARLRWDSVSGSRVVSKVRDFDSGPNDPFGAVSLIDDREMSLYALYTREASVP
jgi:thermitase